LADRSPGKRVVGHSEGGRRDPTRAASPEDVRQGQSGHGLLAQTLRRLRGRRSPRADDSRAHGLLRRRPAASVGARGEPDPPARDDVRPGRRGRGRLPDAPRPLPAAAAVGTHARRRRRCLRARPVRPARRPHDRDLSERDVGVRSAAGKRVGTRGRRRRARAVACGASRRHRIRQGDGRARRR